MLQLMREGCSYTYPPLSIVRYSFKQLSELEQCRVKKLAQGFNAAARIWTRVLVVESPKLYPWATALYKSGCTDQGCCQDALTKAFVRLHWPRLLSGCTDQGCCQDALTKAFVWMHWLRLLFGCTDQGFCQDALTKAFVWMHWLRLLSVCTD